jgi:hypothetical protein
LLVLKKISSHFLFSIGCKKVFDKLFVAIDGIFTD